MHALFKSNTCHYLIINHHMDVTILEQGRTCIPRMIWTASVFLSIAEVRMYGAIISTPLYAFMPK